MNNVTTLLQFVALAVFAVTGVTALAASSEAASSSLGNLLHRFKSKLYFNLLLIGSAGMATCLQLFGGLDLKPVYGFLTANFGAGTGLLLLSAWQITSVLAMLVTYTLIAAAAWHALEVGASEVNRRRAIRRHQT